MSNSKALLKAINDAIRQQKFDDAIEKSQEFLQKEPKSYQGSVLSIPALETCSLTSQTYLLGVCTGQEGQAG